MNPDPLVRPSSNPTRALVRPFTTPFVRPRPLTRPLVRPRPFTNPFVRPLAPFVRPFTRPFGGARRSLRRPFTSPRSGSGLGGSGVGRFGSGASRCARRARGPVVSTRSCPIIVRARSRHAFAIFGLPRRAYTFAFRIQTPGYAGSCFVTRFSNSAASAHRSSFAIAAPFTKRASRSSSSRSSRLLTVLMRALNLASSTFGRSAPHP